MIPNESVLDWGQKFRWSSSAMIEHDLIISKALVCLYSDPIIQEKLLFRGGTALNKLHIDPASRYSEDIDFVQKNAEPIGPIMNAIRIALDGCVQELRYQGKHFRRIWSKSGRIEIFVKIYRHYFQQGLNGILMKHLNLYKMRS